LTQFVPRDVPKFLPTTVTIAPRLADDGESLVTEGFGVTVTIRHEAERGLAIAVVGQPAELSHTERLLRDDPNRYPAASDPLVLVPLADVGSRLDLFGGVNLLVLAFDAASPLDDAELAGLERLAATPRPSQVILLFGETPSPSTRWSAYLDRGAAILVDPEDPAAAALVAGSVLDALPAEVRLAAARRLPGLRPRFAARLTGEVSASNAAVALASGVPSLVPLLGIPLAAADTIILTKNQALMVYRLALPAGRRRSSRSACSRSLPSSAER
jgi:hypothetical protein